MKKLIILLVALVLINVAMAQWFPLNSGTTNWLLSVFFTDVNIGFAVGDEGIILKTTDGGFNWNEKNSGTSFPLCCVHFPKPDTGFVAGFQDSPKHLIILKTVDGGENWTTQFDSLGLGSIYLREGFLFTDANTGFIAGNYGTILKTSDGGTTWVPKNVCADCFITSFHFPSANIGFATASDTNAKVITIFKTLDGGESWAASLTDSVFLLTEGWSFSSIHFPDINTGYACGLYYKMMGIGWIFSKGIFFKTHDGGSSWSRLDTISGWGIWPITTIHLTGPETGYLVGHEASQGSFTERIYMTMDGGENLTAQYVSPNAVLSSIHFPGPDTGYIVGEGGIILKTTNGGIPVGIEKELKKTANLTIYPSPSWSQITLETTLNSGHLTILSVSGLPLIQHRITESRTILDISTLPPGVYFVRVQDEKLAEVAKIIKE